MSGRAKAIGTFLCGPLRGDARWRILLVATLALLILTKMHLPGSYYEFRAFYHEDDAFYYTKIATQFWHHGFPTFDGITHTNGYQPLWMLIAIITAAPLVLFNADHLMPFTLGLVNAALILYSAQLFFTLLRRADISAHAAIFGVALSFGLPMFPYIFNLMETTSTILSILLLLIYLQTRLHTFPPANTLSPLPLAALSFLVLMSRLDAGVFLLMLYAVLLLWFPLRRIVFAGLILCAFTLPYFAYNHYLNGDIMPISGLVKSEWSNIAEFQADGHTASSPADYWNSNLTWQRRLTEGRNGVAEPLSRFLELITFGAWYRPMLSPLPFPVTFIVGIFVCLFAILASAFIYALAHWRKFTASQKFLVLNILVLLIFFKFQLFYYPFFSHIIYPWYLGLALVTLLLCFGLLLIWIMERFAKQCAPHVVCALLLFLAIMDIAAWQRERAFLHHFYLPQNGFAAAAEWFRLNTPENARIGAWTAGQLGQYSERSVTNMEGLVADRAVFDTYKDMDPAKYILENNITHLANHYPYFENGLRAPETQRPDWVEIDTYKPSIAMFWDALTVPDIARGQRYTRWGWNVFWDHRYRPLFDYPEVFTVAFKQRTQTTAIYIFNVNHETLKREIDNREHLMGSVKTLASTLEAESDVSGEDVRAVLHLPRSSAYAITGKKLSWTLNIHRDSDYQIYALLRVGAHGLGATSTILGTTAPLLTPLNQDSVWELLPIMETPATFKSGTLPLTLTGLNNEPFDPITREETATYIDQLFIVEVSRIPQFTSIADSLLKWMNRAPHIPLDPNPTPPRVPTDF